MSAKGPEGDPEKPGAEARAEGKATANVLQVLSAFAADVPSFGVTELSRHLGMTKNMVHRALTTLVDQGYLMRDATGARYQLGLRVLELQDPSLTEPDLRTLCTPYLRRLQELSGETVRLAVRTGDSIVIVDGVESRRQLASRVSLGAMFPLHISPASRVLLAFLGDEEIAGYIARNTPLRARTRATITDPARLWDDIRQTRERGYTFGYGDGSLSTASVAFPLHDADNRLHGSIVVVGPDARFRERLVALMPDFVRIVEDLNSLTRVYSAAVQTQGA